MGRWVVGLAACSLLHTSTAHADDAQPTPAPVNVSWYGTVAPAATQTEPPRIRHLVMRGGAFVLAGFSYAGDPYGRFDLGVPAGTHSFPRLRVVLASELWRSTDADATSRRELSLTPTLQYDWHLPIQAQRGEVLLIVATGLKRAETWVKKPDEPFWPSKWESMTGYWFKAALGLEYRGFSGLVVSAQPSLALPLDTPDPPDSRFMKVTPERTIGFAVMAGYQFR